MRLAPLDGEEILGGSAPRVKSMDVSEGSTAPPYDRQGGEFECRKSSNEPRGLICKNEFLGGAYSRRGLISNKNKNMKYENMRFR